MQMKRFERIFREGNRLTSGETQILVDQETGVQYLWHCQGYAGGITPLLDADGKPVLDPKYKNKPCL